MSQVRKPSLVTFFFRVNEQLEADYRWTWDSDLGALGGQRHAPRPVDAKCEVKSQFKPSENSVVLEAPPAYVAVTKRRNPSTTRIQLFATPPAETNLYRTLNLYMNSCSSTADANICSSGPAPSTSSQHSAHGFGNPRDFLKSTWDI